MTLFVVFRIVKQHTILEKISSHHQIFDSIVVSIPACHAGDRGSIPRRGGFFCFAIIYATAAMREDENNAELFHVSRYLFTRTVLVQNLLLYDVLVNFSLVFYMTQICMSLCSRIKV